MQGSEKKVDSEKFQPRLSNTFSVPQSKDNTTPEHQQPTTKPSGTNLSILELSSAHQGTSKAAVTDQKTATEKKAATQTKTAKKKKVQITFCLEAIAPVVLVLGFFI